MQYSSIGLEQMTKYWAKVCREDTGVYKCLQLFDYRIQYTSVVNLQLSDDVVLWLKFENSADKRSAYVHRSIPENRPEIQKPGYTLEYLRQRNSAR